MLPIMKGLLAVLFASLLSQRVKGLECYACDTYASGGACEFDPASTGIITECSDKYDHCFTRRIEEEGRNSVEIYRGCCRVEEGSPTCPPGDDYQVKTENVYTYYFTRCTTNLCNDTDGLEDETDQGDGALIVEGVPEDYDYFNKEEFKKEETREELQDNSGTQIIIKSSLVMLISTLTSLISI